MTLAIPAELKEKMNNHPEFNWSEIARQAFKKKLSDLERFKELIKDSEMTEEDALIFGRELKKKTSIRFIKSLKNGKNI